MTGCPRGTDLEMFVAGSLPGGKCEQIAAHLDECSSCQDVVETLSGAEPFLSEVARQLGRPTPDIDERLARVMSDAQNERPTTGTSSSSRSARSCALCPSKNLTR